MRYWILVVLLNGLFALVMHFAAPEMFGSTEHYVGAGICALIAIVITWRDPPGMLDNALLFLIKWGIVASGLAFFSGVSDTSWNSGGIITPMKFSPALLTSFCQIWHC